jgi:hypothetical protein
LAGQLCGVLVIFSHPKATSFLSNVLYIWNIEVCVLRISPQTQFEARAAHAKAIEVGTPDNIQNFLLFMFFDFFFSSSKRESALKGSLGHAREKGESV